MAKVSKVFLVCVQDYYDYEDLVRQVSVCETLEEAKTCYQSEVSYAQEQLSENGITDWIVDESEYRWEAYPDGEWGTSHYIVQLKEVEVGKIANLLIKDKC